MMEFALNDPNLQNLVAYNELKHTYQFMKDLEGGIKANEYLKDEHMAIMKWYFVRVHDIQLPEILIMQFLQLEGLRRIINPIKEWLQTIEWDGMYRLDSWLHLYTGCELNEYTAQVGRILLCGAVKRIIEPGCKFDYMMILEGEQGIMKSTLFEVLGGEYYISLSFGHNEKEIVENIQGAWFIEIADMNGFKKQEVEWLRAFITRKSDRCRMPYARNSKDFERQNVFVATTNPSGDNEYLKDDTGNRRFFPIRCGKMNIQGLRGFRDQLFAEAYRYYKTETLYLTGKAEEISLKEQSEREENDIWTIPIKTWLMGRIITNTAEVLVSCLHIELNKASLYDKIRIGKIMRKLQWPRRKNKYGEWEYHNPDLIPAETVSPHTHPAIEASGTQENITWEE